MGGSFKIYTKGRKYKKKLTIKATDIEVLEKAIDNWQSELPELTNFILPGGELSVAQCHVARTICRRAERRIIEFSEENEVQSEIVIYVNRLSDFLFVLARKLGADKGLDETSWQHS